MAIPSRVGQGWFGIASHAPRRGTGLARGSLRFRQENRNAMLPNSGLVVVFHSGWVGSRPVLTRNDNLGRATAHVVRMRTAASDGKLFLAAATFTPDADEAGA